LDWAHELLVYFGFTLCAMAVDVEAAGSDMVLPRRRVDEPRAQV
jgi:hypothetical protein